MGGHSDGLFCYERAAEVELGLSMLIFWLISWFIDQ